MATNRDEWANNLSAEPDSLMGNFLADEEPLDRGARWRLASWGTGAVGALVVAILASQTSVEWRRDRLASADMLARQSQQIQIAARETQNEARRLAAAIDTLNSDRDRLFSRVASVEKNLDSVTGSIARQIAAAQTSSPAPPPQLSLPPAPTVAPVESVAAADPAPPRPPARAEPAIAPTPSLPAIPSLVTSPPAASKSVMALPDPAATKSGEATSPLPSTPDTTASVRPPEASSPPTEQAAVPAQRTEFGIDLGSANTVDGLRALWRVVSAANKKTMAGLRPVMVMKERGGGYGTQLRLVAGPLGDAAAAAKLCASMTKVERGCETSVFDGQRLALKSDPPASSTPPPIVIRPTLRRRATSHIQQPPPKTETEVKPPEEPAPKPQSAVSSFLGIRN